MRKWSKIKNILNAYGIQGEVYLSLIKEDGNIVCANSTMLKKFHLENPRLVRMNILDVIHPVNILEFKKGIRDSINDNGIDNIDLYLKNGHYYPMKWSIRPVNFEEGMSKKYLCIGKNIVDSKELNSTGYRAKYIKDLDTVKSDFEYLKTHSENDSVSSGKKKFDISISSKSNNENIVSGFMNQTPNLTWIVDENAKLIFASQAFYQFFGLDEKESINKNALTLVPSSVAERLYVKHLHVLKTGKALELIENTKLANGQSLAFHINLFPIEGNTSVRYIGGQAVNLKEKFAVEKQLQEANNRLLMLTRATSDAIWEWDLQTGKVFRNDVLMDLVGYHQEDNKGLSWWFRRIHPIDRYRVKNKIKESSDNKLQSWEDEYRFKCADGTYKHMRDKGYIVYENGLPVKMIGSLQDITALKKLENSLLEEKIERQNEITETVIHVQEKERTRIGLELHDNVNQILSTTKLYMDMLDPLEKEQIEIKKKSIEYIALAIEEIRKLSKELVIPQLNNKNLSESIQSVIEDIHLTTSLKINFSFDEDNDMLTSGKKLTIFRIVQEQVKNILKHSEATILDISLINEEDNIRLVIKDNGIGFDSNMLNTGIGLSNIYERTRFYNGKASINTSPGQGCTLTVTIPF